MQIHLEGLEFMMKLVLFDHFLQILLPLKSGGCQINPYRCPSFTVFDIFQRTKIKQILSES